MFKRIRNYLLTCLIAAGLGANPDLVQAQGLFSFQLGPQTVVGNPRALPGPGAAIPFSVLTNSLLQASAIPVVPDTFGTVDRTGATDMGGLINSAITAAKSCQLTATGTGNATVYLKAGTYLVTTPIVPKSCVTIRGDGPGKTVLLTNSNAPFGPPVSQQLVHFNLDGVTFKESGTHASAVAMTFPSIQDSRLTNL